MPNYKPTITKEEVAELPTVAFSGEIVVVDTAEGLAEACNYLLGQSVLGFDTESRPSFHKGVVNRIALLQLSTSERCFLFRLNKINLDKAILKILENKNIMKIGLSVAGDIRELSTLRPFRPKGFVDLQKMAPEYGIEELSLLKIAALVLGRRISKAQRLSNWEAVQLTDAQRVYAATDAWVCTEIYNHLKNF
jgi:ribonuclease D